MTTSLSIHSQTDIVLVGGSNKSLEIYDMNEGKCARIIPDVHSRAVHCICQNKVPLLPSLPSLPTTAPAPLTPYLSLPLPCPPLTLYLCLAHSLPLPCSLPTSALLTPYLCLAYSLPLPCSPITLYLCLAHSLPMPCSLPASALLTPCLCLAHSLPLHCSLPTSASLSPLTPYRCLPLSLVAPRSQPSCSALLLSLPFVLNSLLRFLLSSPLSFSCPHLSPPPLVLTSLLLLLFLNYHLL